MEERPSSSSGLNQFGRSDRQLAGSTPTAHAHVIWSRTVSVFIVDDNRPSDHFSQAVRGVQTDHCMLATITARSATWTASTAAKSYREKLLALAAAVCNATLVYAKQAWHITDQREFSMYYVKFRHQTMHSTMYVTPFEIS